MSSTRERLTAMLTRDRHLGAAGIATKVARSALAMCLARACLRACDVVGVRARCFGRPHVVNDGTIRIGDDFALSCSFGVVHIATGRDGVVEIGDDVSINYGTAISARSGVRIGHHSKIGPYCVLSDTDLPLPLGLPEADDPRAIVIGENVWLGARVTVLPGVTIGDGAVVSAGSVVASDVPRDAVVSGSPARVLRVARRDTIREGERRGSHRAPNAHASTV